MTHRAKLRPKAEALRVRVMTSSINIFIVTENFTKSAQNGGTPSGRNFGNLNLKLIPLAFWAILRGKKPFGLRKNAPFENLAKVAGVT